MKETYRVKCPSHIKWGDPLYFKQYEGEKLEKLILNLQPPNRFDARLVLQEERCKESPSYMVRTMALYMAPEQTIETYMQQMMYEGQEATVKNIGVDSACYHLKIDGYSEDIRTGGDGYWGDYQEFFRTVHGNKCLDAAIVTILMPDYMTMEDVRGFANRFLENMTQIENVEAVEEGQEMNQ